MTKMSDAEIDAHCQAVAAGIVAPPSKDAAAANRAAHSAMALTADGLKSLSSIARSLETLSRRTL